MQNYGRQIFSSVSWCVNWVSCIYYIWRLLLHAAAADVVDADDDDDDNDAEECNRTLERPTQNRLTNSSLSS